MLVILPILLYLVFALAIMLLQRTKFGFGASWFIAAISSFVVWGIVLAYHWYQPPPFILEGWVVLSDHPRSLVLSFDAFSWQYAFTLAALALGVILTAPARLQYRTMPWAWAGSLLVTSMGLLAILAGNPLTLALAWGALDLIEVVFILIILRKEFDLRTIISFGARISAVMLVIWTMAHSRSQGRELTLTGITPEEGLYFLLAVGLRLGIFPFYIPYTKELSVRRGLGTILRLASPLSSLVLLGRLKDLVLPTDWAVVLSVFTAMAALYGSLMWLFAKDELSGRPYWLIAFAGMAFTCVVRGQTEASYALGIAMVLNGAVLFLASDLIHNRRILYIPLLSFIAMTGLPFSPTAIGWNGLVVLPFNLLDIVFILSYAVLLLGFLRHAFEPGEEYPEGERWIRAMFVSGLMLLVISEWLIGILEVVFHTSEVWWAGVVSFFLALVGFAIYLRFPINSLGDQPGLQWLKWLIEKVSKPAVIFFRFDWFYRLVWEIYRLLQSLLNGMTVIFEGEGGVLWSLLLFMLLFFLVQSRGGE